MTIYKDGELYSQDSNLYASWNIYNERILDVYNTPAYKISPKRLFKIPNGDDCEPYITSYVHRDHGQYFSSGGFYSESTCKNQFVRNNRLDDSASLLNESERNELLKRLNALSEELNLDVLIVTTTSTEGKNPYDWAKEYLSIHAPTIGNKGNYLMLLVAMESRDYDILSSLNISQDDYSIIQNAFLSQLSAGEYFQSFLSFCTASEAVIQKYA